MKNLSLWLGAALLAVGCSQTPQKTTIKGELNGLTAEDSVLVICGQSKDTLAAPNGVFSYEYTDTITGTVQFYKLPRRMPNGRIEAFRMRPLLVLISPKQTLTVKGNFDTYEVTGSDFYTDFNAASATLAVADSARQTKNQEYRDLAAALAGQSDKSEELKAKFKEVIQTDSVYQDQVIDYVSSHLDADASLYLLYLNRSSKGADYIEKFSESVKKGNLSKFYKDLSAYYEKMAARKKAAELIKVGKPAPDFTLKNLAGEDFSLSSLRGKYVVLDFWGSWCGWCIKGFPEMKKMYAKYNNKLEVVGVDCRDTKEKWEAAVAKHELPWINVINSDEKGKDLTTVYNVGGFPTKLIISPKGEIVEIVVGEQPEFYTRIQQLMK